MKKFINEYKAFRFKSDIEISNSKNRGKVDSTQDMGVFKWLRRERVTVTTAHINSPETSDQHSHSATQIGTIRTEEYKRDLAEFQARRSIGSKELPDTPVKKKCGRHSLPVSCTDCASAHDTTFNYEKKSAAKYKKKLHQRARSATPDVSDGLPNIQFLFQNQVFMPGMFATSYSEPQRASKPRKAQRLPEFTVQKQIDFDEDQMKSPPLFYKNNSLPFDVKNFLDGSRSEEEVDGLKACTNVDSSVSSLVCGKDDSQDKLWEVMSELKSFDQWADEQLQEQNTSKSDDSKSDASVYGLPIASASDLDVNIDKGVWSQGKWGVVAVQVKKLPGVSVERVRRRGNTELNILRKCRHPNIILLMGLYPDVHDNIHIICERCVDSLYGILHVQSRILSAQTAVHYALDIANALVFLGMQGYIHTALTSHGVMVTSHEAAKLADLGACVKLPRKASKQIKEYDMYSPEPQYVNIQDTHVSTTAESEPLISKNPSETYLAEQAVSKEHEGYSESEHYRWQAPELFEPDELGKVHPCAKSDVYSICLILWESCNAAVPWKTLSYEKLKELYTLWNTGIRLPQDGTYPGCLLALLQSGLKLQRSERIDLATLQNTLQTVKRKLDDMEYVIIPARLSKKKSTFSSGPWDTNSPTDQSDCQSPIAQNIQHKAIIHNTGDSSTDSSECNGQNITSPLYDTIRNENRSTTFSIPEKCYISDDDNTELKPALKYQHLPDYDYSSACSTPIARIRAQIKDIGTPGTLHRSDSTEYCSILSPDYRKRMEDKSQDQSTEPLTAKLSRSFTPKSYKPLHIKVPEFNLDSVKSILKDKNGSEPSSYNFDIKNYSLPTTPIARSNKLRKNAWLSGDIGGIGKNIVKDKETSKAHFKEDCSKAQSAPETPAMLSNSPVEKNYNSENNNYSQHQLFISEERSSGSVDFDRDSFTGLKRVEPPQDFSPETNEVARDRTSSWSFKSSSDRTSLKNKVDDELANVNVKPLVAIHERWIYEANRKPGRSMSLPENNRCQNSAVKPASHCVDTLQKSLPQLNVKRAVSKPFRTHPVSPNGKNGGHWEQFCQARDNIARTMNFTARDPERFQTWIKDKGTKNELGTHSEPKIDQSTDTRSIEEFIRDLIRKEFQHILHEISDDGSTATIPKNEDMFNKGVANIMENLRNGEGVDTSMKKDPVKSYSRVKINGNNKPLLQITFSRTGENSLQVLDNCVNVTICDANTSGREKINISMEDTLTAEDVQVHSLKRCQAFNAIQEARSTEDLYIDDDLSTQMQENFGGKVKLIPLHGSLHEILCEKEDDCCLIKVKQENGCDTIYFRCDNSDTEARDAVDGRERRERPHQDTVVFKRSISLVEERFQRIFPKDKRPTLCRRKPLEKIRPKSEVFLKNITKETRFLSNSSPSLNTGNDEVELNIENVMSYQDSSSDECLKCQAENDDFELLEKKIEEDLANSNVSNLTCGCLAKISEENLCASTEDVADEK